MFIRNDPLSHMGNKSILLGSRPLHGAHSWINCIHIYVLAMGLDSGHSNCGDDQRSPFLSFESNIHMRLLPR
jgi:hypothetical protein